MKGKGRQLILKDCLTIDVKHAGAFALYFQNFHFTATRVESEIVGRLAESDDRRIDGRYDAHLHRPDSRRQVRLGRTLLWFHRSTALHRLLQYLETSFRHALRCRYSCQDAISALAHDRLF